MQLAQYDRVRITAIHEPAAFVADAFNVRPPRVGDVACIVEIYIDPPGYELECVDADGATVWLVSISTAVIALERVG
jgi:hypothetical protein